MNPPSSSQSTASFTSPVANTAVRAFLCVAPALGRGLWVLGVRCPFCSTESVKSLHTHRAEEPHGAVRRARCGRGIYEIVPPPMDEWVT